jgi:pyruvate,water dikinase
VAEAVARAAAEREAATAEARASLTCAERAVFDRALADCAAANFVWWSEDHNILIDMRSFIPVRRAALAIGAALGLAAPEDTVFCFYDELQGLCAGTLRWRDLATLVADRRAYYERWRRRRPEMPKFLGTAPETLSDPIMVEIDGVTADFLAAARGGGETTALKGLIAAPGRATGRARVLRTADDIPQLAKDEILVCEGTTSSWTPAFTRIAGCVCDQGGSLSHAAIISREYGVPCVVGTATATAAIHDGDTVEVDGFSGTVRVLARAKQAAA